MRPSRITRALATALIVLTLTLAGGPAARAQEGDLERAVKATFLVRFASFVDWPSEAFVSPGAPLAICVVATDQFADLVRSAAAGERVNGRELQVRRLAAAAPTGCHILYVGAGAGQRVPAALSVVRGRPVLTVTDERAGPTRGAIHFAVADGRVRFHIDRGQAEQNHLTISSRLLDIALTVRRRGGAVR